MHKQHTFDSRFVLLQRWSNDIVDLLALKGLKVRSNDHFIDWDPIKGDASCRRYFRAKLGLNTYIFMDCPPPENISTFIDVYHRLNKAGIDVPTIYASNESDGFILLEDFGNMMLKDILDRDSGDELFNQLLPILSNMANEVNIEGLPSYNDEKFSDEMNLFIDWFVVRDLNHHLSDIQNLEWEKFKFLIIANIMTQPKCFVHRDFHCCNLLKLKNNSIGVIDFQDAMIGPISYDTVSWLWDRYITWPRRDLEKWLVKAGQILAPSIDKDLWLRQCDSIAIQRNLKIIGIFFRLAYRDKKQDYIGLASRFINYTLMLLNRYEKELGNASIWISSYLKEGLNKFEKNL